MPTDPSHDYPSAEALGVEATMSDETNDFRRWQQDRVTQDAQANREEAQRAALRRGQVVSFETREGHLLRGTVQDWGRRGLRCHVLDALTGDHIRKVDWDALRGPHRDAAVAKAERAADMPGGQPGDPVAIDTADGLLRGEVIEGPTLLVHVPSVANPAERLRRVPLTAVREVGLGRPDLDAAPARQVPPPDFEVGDQATVVWPIGSFAAVVVSVEPSLMVATDDGRRLSVLPQDLRDRQPGAGRAQFAALQARSACDGGAR
jgi:hypothetical protein